MPTASAKLRRCAAEPVAISLPGGKSVILFDGVCNLCDGFVQFVADNDPEKRARRRVETPRRAPRGPRTVQELWKEVEDGGWPRGEGRKGWRAIALLCALLPAEVRT